MQTSFTFTKDIFVQNQIRHGWIFCPTKINVPFYKINHREEIAAVAKRGNTDYACTKIRLHCGGSVVEFENISVVGPIERGIYFTHEEYLELKWKGSDQLKKFFLAYNEYLEDLHRRCKSGD